MNRAMLIAGLGIVFVVVGSLIAREQPDRQGRSRRGRGEQDSW